MVTKLDKVDVVTVGVGWTGGIIAAEAAKAGLKVVGLERGKDYETADYQHVHDELKYSIRYELMQDVSKDTLTFRNEPGQKALPMRQLGSFLMGDGLGGAGKHWNGMVNRFLPYDFEVASMTEDKYGEDKLRKDEGYTWQDWGITYDEIEPYYTTIEKTMGVSGQDEGTNPFWGERSEDFPTPPLLKTPILRLFEEGAKSLDLHPFMMPSANLSEQYENPDGETINQCQYCAFCERFACEYDAKATPDVTVIKTAQKSDNFTLRLHANVVEIVKDEDDDSKVTGVKFIDTVTGEEFIQPADIVALTSYVFNNYKLLAVSDIGEQYDPETEEGTLGRNYGYQLHSGATGFFEDKKFNTFMGAGALGMALDDYNGDNFDHEDLDFIHGGLIDSLQMGARPILNNAVKDGTPAWGEQFKEESIKYYTQSLSIGGMAGTSPHRNNYLDLSDEYNDVYGKPLVEMTFNFHKQDIARFEYLNNRCEEIMTAMGADEVSVKETPSDYDIVPYQFTHNAGGTIMGADPETSVVNNWLQHWDRENLFVVGAGNYPHMSGYNATLTVGALAYRCAEGIIKYSKSEKRLEA